MTQAPPPPEMTFQKSGRDPAAIGARLEQWLTTALPPGADPEVTILGGIDANGLSSETVLLDVASTIAGDRRATAYVLRVAPRPEDIPVFATYDLQAQYDAMRLAGSLSPVPVPEVGLAEMSGSILGTPFFLMKRVEGVVPPDVMPYNFGDSWLFEASSSERAALQQRSVEVLAGLHSIPDAASRFGFLDPAAAGHSGETLIARNLAKTRAWYAFASTAEEWGGRSPLVERGLAWLEANLPHDVGEPVLCWGDARIGNIIYRDFAPVAVLDWEMVSLGPREMDVTWMIFAHRIFEDLAAMLELPGMPDFLTASEVKEAYVAATGVELGDLTWHEVHAAVMWGIIYLRIAARQIHFGEIEAPEDPESTLYHRAMFEAMLAEVGA
ncbi:Predicted kinase, aminoglycoside phosphotransferase (APT) family [Nocardioides sp. YR527]|uniref:phosphotransferase family protein n=1 Tax=Nocardioides sp. YR527 TaxID=1881028 RepID=UPI0008883B2D|nr:phosphotransferase family protein [Nocardioides sp. YR527]SDK97385.1 Predicted kinase, aminoglycoside phosphotransferase (APT) family [Nocardioides sp. YR527]